MKFVFTLALWGLLLSSEVGHALSFAPDTIFLVADSQETCEAQGGNFTQWYEETYCTKAPINIAFNDVPREHPHSEAIAYVESHGIVSGYDDGSFRPEATINRVELVKILVEALYREEPACSIDYQYTDTLKESWYQRYVQVASCVEIVSGYPDGSFNPGAPVLITEASKMISNAFGFENQATSLTWYDNFVRNLSLRGALPTSIETIDSELTRGQMAEIIYRLKTGTTNLPSHTLNSLTWSAAISDNPVTDTELDNLFDDIFNEDGLDLDRLLDF